MKFHSYIMLLESSLNARIAIRIANGLVPEYLMDII